MNQEKKLGRRQGTTKIDASRGIGFISEQSKQRADVFSHEDERLREVENQIVETNDRITELNSLLYTDLSEEDMILVRAKIEEKTKERARLWNKQAQIEK